MARDLLAIPVSLATSFDAFLLLNNIKEIGYLILLVLELIMDNFPVDSENLMSRDGLINSNLTNSLSVCVR